MSETERSLKSEPLERKLDEATLLILEKDFPDVDLSQLQRNMNLTPEDRVKEHERALNLVSELARAGERLHDRPQ